MSPCLFCQIVAGEIPNYTLYEDELYLAFLDIHPQSPGHTLIIPKTHYRYVWDMVNPGELLTIAQKLTQHYQSILKTDLFYGSIMGEEVPHAHFHLVPQNVKLQRSLPEIQALLKLPTL